MINLKQGNQAKSFNLSPCMSFLSFFPCFQSENIFILIKLKSVTKLFQVGIISRGILCGTVHRPGVYTRIIPFLDWIYSVTSRFGCYTM